MTKQTPEATDLPALLREATADSHEAIGRVRFFQDLSAGRLTRRAALNYLRGLASIHRELESRLAEAAGPARGLWGPEMARLPDLLRDLEAAGADQVPEDPASAAAAQSAAARVRSAAARPFGLVGFLYVLEGSQMGGQGLRRLFAAALNLPDDRFAYYGGDGKATVARWQAFKKELAGLNVRPAEAAEIARGAVEAFDGIAALARAALP